MKKLTVATLLFIPSIAFAQHVTHDSATVTPPILVAETVTQASTGRGTPTSVTSILAGDGTRSNIGVTIGEAKDTLAHPIIPYPLTVIHQHDDLSNGRTEATARHDDIPNFASMANITINKSMRWSEFLNIYHPKEDDIVLIPQGVEVLYDINCCHLGVGGALKFKGLALEGKLRFEPTVNAKLTVGTIIVGMNAELTIAPQKDIKQEIVFRGKVDKLKDPHQMTIGLLTLGGKIHIEGQTQPTPYARLIGKMQGNTLTVQLSNNKPLTWKVGDEIFLHGATQKANPSRKGPLPNRDMVGGFGVVKIVSINNGQVVVDKNLTALGFEPVNYVAHSTRNVILRSHSTSDRAHLMFNADTDVKIMNAALVDLGRTTSQPFVNAFKVNGKLVAGSNQLGRYPLHLHHLHKAFHVEGNVIKGDRLEHVWQEGQNAFVDRNGTILEAKGSRLFVTNIEEWNAFYTGDAITIAPKEHQIKLFSYYNRYFPVNPTEGWKIDALKLNDAKNWGIVNHRVDNQGFIWVNDGTGEKKIKGYVAGLSVEPDGKVVMLDPATKKNVFTGFYDFNMPIAAPKWAITNHNSFGVMKNNVIIGAEGAGIAGEEGLETGTIKGNLVIGLGGGNGESDDMRWWNMGLTKADLGYGGFGYWFAGALNDVSDNIADGFFRKAAFAYYFPYDFLGAVPTLGGGWRKLPEIEGMPLELKGAITKPVQIWKFDNNESVADIDNWGYSLELNNADAFDLSAGDGYMEINKYKSSNHGIYINGINPTIVLRDLELKGAGHGVGVNGYISTQVTLIGGYIDNFDTGIVYERLGVFVQDTKLTNKKNFYLNDYRPSAVVKEQSVNDQIKERQRLEELARLEAIKSTPGAKVAASVTSLTPKVRLNSFSPAAYGWFSMYVNEQARTIRVVWNLHDLKNPMERFNIGLRVPGDDSRGQGKPWLGSKVIQITYLITKEKAGEFVFGLYPQAFELLKEGLAKEQLVLRVETSGNPISEVHTSIELEGIFKDPFIKPNVVVPPIKPASIPIAPLGVTPTVKPVAPVAPVVATTPVVVNTPVVTPPTPVVVTPTVKPVAPVAAPPVIVNTPAVTAPVVPVVTPAPVVTPVVVKPVTPPASSSGGTNSSASTTKVSVVFTTIDPNTKKESVVVKTINYTRANFMEGYRTLIKFMMKQLSIKSQQQGSNDKSKK